MSSISSLFSIAANGLTYASSRLASTAQKIADPNNLGDLTGNAVDLITEKTSFQASALLLKTANQTTGTLLDILDTDRGSV